MISVVIISILLVMAGWQFFYRSMWAKDLSARFSFGQSYVYATETAELKEIIENRKKIPVTPLEVRFRIRRGVRFTETDNTSVSDFVYKRDIYALLGRQRITRTLQMECAKRGHYRIEDVSVISYSLLHEKTYHLEIDTDAQFYVYAKRVDVSDILNECTRMLGEQESRRKYLEDPFAFASIREYTMQDPMKSINWKASAKTGGLMVNTYTSMHKETIMIYLDLEDKMIMKKEHLIEDSISVAATLFDKLIKKGSQVGIAINGKAEQKEGFFYRAPSSAKVSLTDVERFLTGEWKESETLNFEQILQVQPEGALPVVISKNASEEMIRKTEQVLGKNERGIWVLPHSYGEGAEYVSQSFVFVKREVENL